MRYKKRVILILLLVAGVFNISKDYAQGRVFFKVTLLPPYTAYLSDYSNNYLVTITNPTNTTLDIFLKGSLTNDHGQSAQTKPNLYSLPIHVGALQTVSLMGNQIDPNLFSASKADNNFQQRTIGNVNRDAQLPEGVYTFCITPYSYDSRGGTYTPLPINPPGSNCATFVLSTAKPPIITTPVNGQVVAPNEASALNIAWIRPSGVTGRALIKYTFYIVKVNTGEDPNQAMTNVVEYGAGYFYKVTDLLTPIYQFNNLQPFHLEKGSRYAVMVQAVDNTHSLAIENNGRSEVVTFLYGAPGPPAEKKHTEAPKPHTNGIVTMPPADGNGFGTSILSGNIKYYFTPDMFAPGQALPLSHIPLRLVKEYFIYYAAAGVYMSTTSNSLNISGAYGDGFDVDDIFLNSHKVKEVAYATTDAQGNFVFTFPSSDRTNENYGLVNVSGMPDFMKGANGKFIPKFGKSVPVYDPNTGNTVFANIPSSNTADEPLSSLMSIQILNPYYWGPLVEVPSYKYNSNDSNLALYFEDTLISKNLGQVSSYVGNFNLHVHINPDVQNDGYDKPGDHSRFHVFVLRKKSSSSASNIINGVQTTQIDEMQYSTALPPGESQMHYDKKTDTVLIPNIIKYGPYEVVAIAATDLAGSCDFTRMRCFSGDPQYYFYAVADGENDMNYSMPQVLSLQDLINAGAINFNNNNPTRQLTLNLEPGPGKLYGNVRRTDSKYGVKDAQVSLSVNSLPVSQVSTDITGYYELTPVVNGLSSFKLNASKAGYLDDNVSFPGSLKTGQKIHNDLFIDTAASVFGKIVDKNGDGVTAYVSIENGASVNTQGGEHYSDAQGYDHYNPATFKLGCPKGTQKLIIDPVDNHFEQKIITLSVNQSLIDVGTVTLQTKEQHIKFVVVEYEKLSDQVPAQFGDGGNTSSPKVIANAKVSIAVQGFAGVTDQNGETNFVLTNGNAITLAVKTEGPQSANYIPNTTTVSIPAFTNSKTVYLYLKPGCQVQGFVNSNGKQIPGATVIFKNGAPANWLTTTTDANGYYELHGVPAGNGLTFSAGKQNYMGDEEKGNPSFQKHFTVDFNITKNGNIDFIQMLGFKMVITKYDEANHLISGYFHQLPNNNDFKVLQDSLIPFSNIKVKTGLIPQSETSYFYPEQMPLRTDINKIGLGAKGYNVRLQLADPSGLSIIGKNGSYGYGALAGKAKVDIGAIQDASELIFTDELFLRSSASATQPDDLSTITSDGKAPYNSNLYLSSANGKDMNLTYQGFSITASHTSSAITDNNVCHLEGTLNAQIVTDENGPQKISIPLSKLEFTDHDGVSDRQQKGTFIVPIQQWKIYGDQYTFGPDGFHIDKGHVQTTQVNVPFTDMVLKHDPGTNKDELKYGIYQLQSFDLAGVASLVLEAVAVPQFFFDPNEKLWHLIVGGPANSTIGKIQGLTPINKDLGVSEFSLNSKDKSGHLQLSADSKTVSIYNGLANYTIGYLDVSPDAQVINLSNGVLDLGIPQLSYPPNNSLSFYKQNGTVAVKIKDPLTLTGYVKGVNLSFPVTDAAFQPLGFNVPGSLFETGQNPYKLSVLLHHLPGSSVISIDPAGSKSLFIDKAQTRSVSNLSGSMQTVTSNSDWTKFKFEGDLTGCKNISSHLSFVINGNIDLDKDVSQKVAVSSMSSSGESISSMQFNFATGELRGQINIPKEDLGGGISFGGSATMVVNHSGWFFAGSGNASFPNPVIDGGAIAILFGGYPNAGTESDITSKFTESYFYKKNNSLPANYQKQLDGFLVDVIIKKELIPPTSISWGTGKLDVSFDMFADLYMGATFTASKTLDVGGLVGATANLSASQSLGVICVTGAASAFLDSYFQGWINTGGQYCLTIGGDAGVKGSLEIKAGGCDGSCDNLLGLAPCVDIVPPLGAGVTLGVSYTVGNGAGCQNGISANLK